MAIFSLMGRDYQASVDTADRSNVMSWALQRGAPVGSDIIVDHYVIEVDGRREYYIVCMLLADGGLRNVFYLSPDAHAWVERPEIHPDSFEDRVRVERWTITQEDAQ